MEILRNMTQPLAHKKQHSGRIGPLPQTPNSPMTQPKDTDQEGKWNETEPKHDLTPLKHELTPPTKFTQGEEEGNFRSKG